MLRKEVELCLFPPRKWTFNTTRRVKAPGEGEAQPGPANHLPTNRLPIHSLSRPQDSDDSNLVAGFGLVCTDNYNCLLQEPIR